MFLVQNTSASGTLGSNQELLLLGGEQTDETVQEDADEGIGAAVVAARRGLRCAPAGSAEATASQPPHEVAGPKGRGGRKGKARGRKAGKEKPKAPTHNQPPTPKGKAKAKRKAKEKEKKEREKEKEKKRRKTRPWAASARDATRARQAASAKERSPLQPLCTRSQGDRARLAGGDRGS